MRVSVYALVFGNVRVYWSSYDNHRCMGMAHEKWLQNARDAKRVIGLLVHNKKISLRDTRDGSRTYTHVHVLTLCTHGSACTRGFAQICGLLGRAVLCDKCA
jgi:hypothetical protein